MRGKHTVLDKNLLAVLPFRGQKIDVAQAIIGLFSAGRGLRFLLVGAAVLQNVCLQEHHIIRQLLHEELQMFSFVLLRSEALLDVVQTVCDLLLRIFTGELEVIRQHREMVIQDCLRQVLCLFLEQEQIGD